MSAEAEHKSKGAPYGVAGGILLVIVVYAVALALGAPQHATALIAGAADYGHEAEAGEPAPEEPAAEEDAQDAPATAPEGEAAHPEDEHSEVTAPPLYTVVPFVLLLGAIAVLPLIPFTEHWWESNRNRLLLAVVLGLVTLAYYGVVHDHAVEAHFPVHGVAEPAETGFNYVIVETILANAVLQEYIPFIVLLFSLYTISGGIRIEGDLRANPATNASFMAAGGLLASFIGTTGAAMLLIRPLLETNSERKHVVHTVVFFIFIVCNCGGCLLPIGDPPLFLGYLEGVPFFWTFELWPEWLMCNGILLGLYLALDNFAYYPHESIQDIERDVEHVRPLSFSGVAVNGPLLLGVVAAVAFLDPKKTVPFTDWHPWLYLREVVQLALVATSLLLGSTAVRLKNSFNYHAIQEVGALFIGIFICMQPALQILGVNGDYLAANYLKSPAHFFWVTGALSSVLDNAPTYLVFFKTAQTGATGPEMVAGVPEPTLVAISLGAVFMGAMTYIGNGPNFMVKAIAEKSGVRMPSFFGYMAYSCVILLPVLALVAWQSFR